MTEHRVEFDLSGRENAFFWLIISQDDEKFFNLRLPLYLTENEYHDLEEKRRAVLQGVTIKVPDRDLSWVDGSRRQVAWLEREVELRQLRIPRHMEGVDRCVAIIDAWDRENNFFGDSRFQNQLWQGRWRRLKTAEKGFDWIKRGPKHREKLDFLWGRISRLKYVPSPMVMPLSVEDLILYLDYLKISDGKISEFLKSTKEAWERRVKGANANAKNCGFKLPLPTIEKLKKLSEKYDVTQAQLVDLLIRKEFEQELYIKAQLADQLRL